MKIDLRIGRNFCRFNLDEIAIICHGLPYEAGSVIDKSYDKISEFFSKKGLPSVAFDFSGTGKSYGQFSLLSWLEDLENIASNFERVHVIGFSMGGAIAYNINAVSYSIVSSPFSLMFDEEALRDIYSNAILKGTLKGLKDFESFKNRFIDEFLSIAPENAKPKRNVLIIHGTDDNIVPLDHGMKLFEHSKKPKKLIIIEDGDHFLRKRVEIYEIIYEWIVTKDKEGEKIESIRI